MARRTTSHNEAVDSPARMLAIGLPQTPGLPPLPSARAEVELLQDIAAFKDSFTLLYREEATVEAVTKALPEHNWIHACCHGHYDPEHPLDSAFHLVDGSVTLSRIVQMQLKDAEFAFLSACHSARHTAFGPDESPHLAAGLQVAGVRDIIGTAWSMVDRDGPQPAERF